LACRTAIKAGQRLTMEEMESLLKDMTNDEGGHCPHGRPTVLTLTMGELASRFGRGS
jgi:DNA mismatch repair protein MutL